MTHTTDHRMDATEGVAETARDEAGQLKETSTEAAREVAGTVREKASEVTADAREQTRRLAGQARDELVGQASRQKDRAVDGLRSVGDELRGMAEHGRSGLGAQLARQGAGFMGQAADFLQQHEPGDLLEEVRGFARRRPGTFLLVAAAAGVVAGRLTRALAAGGTGTPNSTVTPFNTGSSSGSNGLSEPSAADDYLVPPPVAPDLDPGAPVTPRPGSGL